ncbi:hypothetical protein SBOR_9504 [Sclerotinia borealis F-4128]|uniref:Uncharacterized protein n=1 Tax=Sclerotinia borealis (strain F-4128) TaxID=1432307 RepID=W9C2J2_SCLBF|nr:hypothetical protein SBOR_9504 [Sclerotinia borealis F-4128]
MPPKQKSKPKGSAPVNRIYKAVEPLHQTTFPEKRIRVTRNYGKKIKLEKQDTLTQMDWVKLHEKEQEDEIGDDIEDSEEGFEEEESKRRTKRRRTMDDEPTAKKKKELKNRRKTTDEGGRMTSFSTQTITQLDYWPLSGAQDEPDEPEDDGSSYDIPVSSPPAVHPPRRSPRKFLQPNVTAPVKLLPPPQTPSRRNILEIPSSQSPATPTSSQFGGSARKRSPLKEQSTNIAVPFSLRSNIYKSAEKLPRLKVVDTYETGTDESQVIRTPSKRSSPAKTVRFAFPDLSPEVLAEETPIKQKPATQRSLSPSPTRRLGTPAPNNIRFEILDSDAEEDEEDEESQVVTDTPIESNSDYETRTNAGDSMENIVEEPEQDDARSEMDTGQTEVDAEKELELPETFYGDIGAETQFHAEQIMSSSSLSNHKESSPLNEDAPKNRSYGRSQCSQSQYIATQHNQTQYTQIQTQTQHTQTQRTHTQRTQAHTQLGKSQYPESQRLSTQHLDAMAPRSEASDVFISIYPTHVENIITRKKNYEFRSYNFPATVSRIWIYQTKPLSTLTHMAVIGPPKKPGEITNFDGLGNLEFNTGETRSKFGYEILELYALANPMTFEELKSRQWFRAAPQKYARVPPAVLGELIANLLPPLFTQSSSSLSSSATESSEDVHAMSILHRTSSTSTESQEVRDQITHNIQQFTQARAPPSSPPAATPASAIHVLSSQNHFVRPSQASTVDYTQTETPVTPRRLRRESSIPDLILESPTKSIPSSSHGSSPVQTLPPAISRRGERRVIEIESQSDDENEGEENNENERNQINHDSKDDVIVDKEQVPSSTPQPYSLIQSSQLISRSQIMREQDSLMDREIMRPPPTMGGKWKEVGDSDEDDDEDL